MQFKSIKLKNTREVLNHTLHHIGGKVLDLGAGGAKYKGLILKRAEEYRACDAIKNESIDDICDVLNLKYPEEHFDTIVSTQVIEHIPNPYRMVSQKSFESWRQSNINGAIFGSNAFRSGRLFPVYERWSVRNF